MSEIGKQMIVTYANVTTVVDNLEKLGYARRTRDAVDRRRIRVGLTPAGYKIFEKIHSAHVRQIEGLMEALDERELRKLMRYAEKIRKKAAV